MPSSRPAWPPIFASLLLSLPGGLLLGWFSWWADGLVGDGQVDVDTILASLGNVPTLWIVAAFCIGAVARQVLVGAVAGVLLLAVATVTYYVLHQTGERALLPQRNAAEAWLTVSLIVGPAFGAAGSAWRAGTSLQVPAVALICGAIAGCGVFIFQERSGAVWGESAQVVLAAAHIVAAFVLVPFMLRHSHQRAAAILLVAFGGIVSAAAIAVTLDLVGDAIA